MKDQPHTLSCKLIKATQSQYTQNIEIEKLTHSNSILQNGVADHISGIGWERYTRSL
ncbi:hypothetical protein J6590_013649 [Homalodisca vitripennis]|nr:hypothetical protein J6590_013649 [Homalodisca vitripennis]